MRPRGRTANMEEQNDSFITIQTSPGSRTPLNSECEGRAGGHENPREGRGVMDSSAFSLAEHSGSLTA